MRVAFLVGAFPQLSETFILSQITGLIDRGIDVDVYGWPSGDEYVHEDVDAYDLAARTHYAPTVPDSYVRRLGKAATLLPRVIASAPGSLGMLNVGRYGRLAASLRPLYASIPHLRRNASYDVAHCHFGQNGLLGLVLREHGLLDARSILTTFHGRDVYVDLPSYSDASREMLFEKGDGFTVNSTFTADNVVRLGGSRGDIWKLPVGLDVDQFPYAERTRTGDEPVRLLTVGRLVEKKGIEYAIRAVARLRDVNVDVDYRIVGGGTLQPDLERLVRDLDLTDEVTFLGAQPQSVVREQYAWAHLFVLASVTAEDGDREGQGLVLQEAQACGLPVVATRHNGFPDGVREGESALLVPERDPEALADALHDLIGHDERWQAMGQAGRQYVERHYDIDVLNDRLVDIYRDLA